MNDLKSLYEKNKTISLIYIGWFSINLLALFISDSQASHVFYPFGKLKLNYISYSDGNAGDSVFHAYDFSEFFVYTIIPLVIFFIYNQLKRNKV